ncbi:MAG: hypothetical protein LBH59_09410 [Planctomycetaceae bacterium]|nr:hypothetical protein [Planctomycetaceae bacterium]
MVYMPQVRFLPSPIFDRMMPPLFGILGFLILAVRSKNADSFCFLTAKGRL